MMPKYRTTSSGVALESASAGRAVPTTFMPSCVRCWPMLWLISSVAPALNATGLRGAHQQGFSLPRCQSSCTPGALYIILHPSRTRDLSSTLWGQTCPPL
jgi:hypothetical protein